MATVVKTFYKNQDLLYKLLLIAVCSVLIVYFLPKSGKFQYDFQKGFPWANENLYADEDFAILKSEETLAQEREEIRSQAFLYFDYDEKVMQDAITRYDASFSSVFKDSLVTNVSISKLQDFGRDLLVEMYATGIAKEKPTFDASRLVYLKKGSEVTQVNLGQIYEDY